MEPFSFAVSSSLHTPLRVRIIDLEGSEPFAPYSDLLASPEHRHIGSNATPQFSLFVTLQVFAGAKPLTAPVQTSFKVFRGPERRWNEWLTLPIPYSSLPRDACLAITLWDLSPAGITSNETSTSSLLELLSLENTTKEDPSRSKIHTTDKKHHIVPFGGTTIPLFSEDQYLNKGTHRCHVHRHRQADSRFSLESSTPAVPKPNSYTPLADPTLATELAEQERMYSLLKRHDIGEIPSVEWADHLVFRNFRSTIERIKRHAAQRERLGQPTATSLQQSSHDSSTAHDDSSASAMQQIMGFKLNIELPRFDHAVVFSDHEYPPKRVSVNASNGPVSASPNLPTHILSPPPALYTQQAQFPSRNTFYASSAIPPPSNYPSKVALHAPSHHHQMDTRESPLQADDLTHPLFPVYDAEVGARDNPADAKHRRLFRSVHRNGMMDKDLKPNAKSRDDLHHILSYPPTQSLTSEEANLIWLFRYHLTRDSRALTKFVQSVNWHEAAEAKQAAQLLTRWTEIAVDDALELLGPSYDSAIVRAFAVDRLRKAHDDELQLYLLQLVQALKYEHALIDGAGQLTHESSLGKFLITRACANFTLCNYFHWYLMVECDDDSGIAGNNSALEENGLDTPSTDQNDSRSIYRKIAYQFMLELVRQPEGPAHRKILLRQAQLITILSTIASEIKISTDPIPRKLERVKAFLADPANELVTIQPPLPLPLDPSIGIVGVVPEDSLVFKSSLCPIKVTFRTTTGSRYSIIFKIGDDLRQDQLVIQIISLMDRLLQKENLDLKLSPYKILATSASAGASQFVLSTSFQSIAYKYRQNPVLAYLKQHNPDPSQPLGIRPETLDTYIRSCAGYCVITYILGVGDRHLDNLLLAPDGHFFHADFGFILGRDPKPFAPVMKLSKEMVDCMGGSASDAYKQFKQYCFLAYTTLRKQSNLLLNLFSLMVDANIPDIRLEPDKAVLKVRERFHLDMSEEDAIRKLDRIIEDTLVSLAPVVIDKLHELVQAFRA